MSKTNFQRVTASPEALAEFIKNFDPCVKCPAKQLCDEYRNCKKSLLEWLKQEVKE